MKDTFKQLYEKHKGKISDKWSLYLEEWNQLFSTYRDQEIDLLEIGIQNGGSLEVWSEYFTKANKIIGCDIDEKCLNLTFDDPRISLVVSDANTVESEQKILSLVSKLDIIIDDGSHTSSDIIKSFARYFPHLNDGGIYIAEDLHCSYWEDFEGGLYNLYSSVAFFKRLADIVNFEHWRNNIPRKYLLSKFTEKLNIEFEELDLARIHSVEFINSLCVIKKLPPERNSVGKRVIVGIEEGVTSNWEKLKNTAIQDLTMKINQEYTDAFDLVDKIKILNETVATSHVKFTHLREQVESLKGQITNLNEQLIERDQKITNLNEQLIERDQKIINLNREIAQRDKQIIDLDRETVRRGEWALGLEAELNEERTRLRQTLEVLNEVIRSNSWRLMLPLRETRRWISEPAKQTKRYTRKTLKLAKRIYQALPVKTSAIENHRNLVAKYAPKLLSITETRFDGREKSVISNEALEELHVPDLPQEIIFFNDSSDSVSRAQTIEIPASDNPVVSVIIPIYGKIDYTLNCLASIAIHSSKVPFEVIVIDDWSLDNSVEVLEQVKGIRLIRNEHNQGFIKSCNAGAKAAKGKYLYFLNNDTQVTSGWMDELFRTFHEFPGTGLVGSKLIYPEGKLQEAGGIIWQDGSAWNFGRLQNPQLPVYSYAREVDYCSGASIMVPKKLFHELGGFDEYYTPAYCEDSDLALKIRDKGYRVIYQPLSTIIHYEGITSGTSTSEGAKAYQIENTKKLYSRWKDRLATYQAPGTDVDNAKDRRAKKRVLVLEHCIPTPNQDAGSVTVFNLMLLLREMDFQVTFIPEDNFLYVPEYTTALQRIGVEVLYAPYVVSVEQHLKEFGKRYDLTFLFRPSLVARNIKKIRDYSPQSKVLYYTHDLHFLRMSREATLLNDSEKVAEAEAMKLLEFEAIRSCDASILVSEQELRVVQDDLAEKQLHVLPLILNTPGTKKSFSDRKDIVFVGGFQHTPNIDAVMYFVTQIIPLIRESLPGVRFYSVGSKVPDVIKQLESDEVIITGFVEDLAPLLDKMRVSVAPLRYGAGIKGKVGTAMAAGLPVVATSLAAEGMALTPDENILIADSTEDFAKSIIEIYQDEILWNKISQKSVEFAKTAWGAEAAWNAVSDIITKIGVAITRGRYPLSLYSEFDISKVIVDKHVSKLTPIASVKDQQGFIDALKDPKVKSVKEFEKGFLQPLNVESFKVNGVCAPCNREVSFLVDMTSGGQQKGDIWLPNWRERLECPFCGMNNRQRLMATLIKQILKKKQNSNVYLMEQITPIFKWVTESFADHNITGSEYLGFEYEGGTIVNNIRHEDVENLTFSDGEMDLIVSNDVFEHIPNPAKAFAECARILKPKGVMLMSIPFVDTENKSVTRAKISQGELHHIFEPTYHGNPVSEEGSLVFTDFGWDVFNEIHAAGFGKASLEIYCSIEFGHLGNGQLIFHLVKS